MRKAPKLAAIALAACATLATAPAANAQALPAGSADLQLPAIQIPQVQLPQIQIPNIQLPQIQLPGLPPIGGGGTFSDVAGGCLPPSGDQVRGVAADIVRETNAYRASQGRSTLPESGASTGLAQQWANHSAAFPAAPGQSLHDPANNDQGMAENVYISGDCRLPSGREIVQAWIDSPGHRSNLLAAEDKNVGVGIAYSPITNTWVISQKLQWYSSPAAPL